MTVIKQHIEDLLKRFPRHHLAVAGTTLLTLFLALLLLPGENAEAHRTAIPLQLELSPQLTNDISSSPELEDNIQIEPAIQWQETTVGEGDSLSVIFDRMGLSANALYGLLQRNDRPKDLVRLKPKQKLAFHIDEQGNLEALRIQVSPLKSLIYERSLDGYKSQEVTREPEIIRRSASAEVTSSLYMAALDAQIPENLVMQMANIFGSVIDFVYDVRAGDRFTVIYEELWLEGEKLGTGKILAAQYTNRGDDHQAYRYVDADGDVGYYSADGISMRKAFLRAPLDFTRISSNFNLKRLHPIHKVTRPHRGVDYAAPRGTPVYAAGDGRVTAASFSKGNGNYVFIQHGQTYVTKYLHLHKRAVKKGARVQQGQIIGWVGSTGYATGPHLHYEFLVNGVHRNPRTVHKSLPKAESLHNQEMPRFQQAINGIRLQLNTYARHHERQLEARDKG